MAWRIQGAEEQQEVRPQSQQTPGRASPAQGGIFLSLWAQWGARELACSEPSFLRSHLIAVLKGDCQGPKHVEIGKSSTQRTPACPGHWLQPPCAFQHQPEALVRFGHFLQEAKDPSPFTRKPEKFKRNCLQSSSREDTEWTP